MAAVVQTQVDKFQKKLKPYLYEGSFASYWSLLEQKTNVKRDQAALGLLGFFAVYLCFGWANDFICNLVGFLYPAYASVLAVESKVTHDDTEWLIYWVVYAVFGIVEYIGYTFFHSLPFYWLAKCLFLLWLMAPGQRGGSHILYHRLIRPFVLKHQPTVDRHVQNASDYIKPYMAGDNH